MISRTLRVFLALAVLLCLPTLTPTVDAQQDNQGFIYGRVVTHSGTEYEGFLRWGTQEAAWDDLFNSVKEDLPFYRSPSTRHVLSSRKSSFRCESLSCRRRSRLAPGAIF